MKSLFVPATFLFLSVAPFTAHAETALGNTMKDMEMACKQLGPDLKQTDDTKHAKDADLQSVATIKASGLKARDMVPKKAQTLPPDQQATMTAAYQKDMDMFLKDAEALDLDIHGDKWDAARADFQKLMDDQHADHKLYRVKK